MSPTRLALARVLRAWLSWPGVDDDSEEETTDEDWILYDLGGALGGRGVVGEDDSPTPAGRALLAEHEAAERAAEGAL